MADSSIPAYRKYVMKNIADGNPDYHEELINRELTKYLVYQKNSIAQDFVYTMGTCLVAASRQDIARFSDIYGWLLLSLPKIRASSAIVIQKNKTNPTELWVRHDYSDYRKAFIRYFSTYYSKIDTLPRKYQVDHLLPKALFTRTTSNYFIRIILIEGKINSSYGSGFEKMFYVRERERTDPIGGYHMDWIALCKLFEINIPGKNESKKNWEIWAKKTANTLCTIIKIDYNQIFNGLLTVLTLGYTGHYPQRMGN